MIYIRFIKPLIDFILALMLLLVFLPFILITALAIYIFIGKPILFTQSRPGKNEKLFKIYKFRTMTNEIDTQGNLLPDAQRLKGVGKIIRSLSLDELPQLFNIFKGEMSFIGPRPLLPEYLPLYNETQKKRHHIKPGITGWAQINGRNAISWKEKFELDVYYVNNISFYLDMKIFILTLMKVLRRDGVSANNHVTIEKFNGSN